MARDLDCWVVDADDRHHTLIKRFHELSISEGERYRGHSLDLRLTGTDQMNLVAGFGDTVMGALVAVLDPGHGWVITLVHVQSGAREVGLGDALMRAFLDRAALSGTGTVMAQARPGDRATKNLYERHGLVAQTIVVGRDLSDPTNGADVSR